MCNSETHINFRKQCTIHRVKKIFLWGINCHIISVQFSHNIFDLTYLLRVEKTSIKRNWFAFWKINKYVTALRWHTIHHNDHKLITPKQLNLLFTVTQSPCRWTQCAHPRSGTLTTTFCTDVEGRCLNKAIGEDGKFTKHIQYRSVSCMGK